MFRNRPPDNLPHTSSETRFVRKNMQHFVHPLPLKNAFRARLPSNLNSSRCETEAFVRDFLQIPTVQDCETEAFVPDFLQIPTGQDMKAKLSCKTSFNFQQVKLPTGQDVKTKLSCEPGM